MGSTARVVGLYPPAEGDGGGGVRGLEFIVLRGICWSFRASQTLIQQITVTVNHPEQVSFSKYSDYKELT